MFDLGVSLRRVVSCAPQSLYARGVDSGTHRWVCFRAGTLLALLAVESLYCYHSVLYRLSSQWHSVLYGLRAISDASTRPCWQTDVLHWYSLLMTELQAGVLG
jgi:hypothetical protein